MSFDPLILHSGTRRDVCEPHLGTDRTVRVISFRAEAPVQIITFSLFIIIYYYVPSFTRAEMFADLPAVDLGTDRSVRVISFRADSPVQMKQI